MVAHAMVPRAQYEALQRRLRAAEARNAETESVINNTRIAPHLRLFLLILQAYAAELDRAGKRDPATGELPIHLPELARRYGRCTKTCTNLLQELADLGFAGYRVVTEEAATGGYRTRSHFRPPADTREAWCGLAAELAGGKVQGRPPAAPRPEEYPLKGYAVTYEQTVDVIETSGAHPRILSQTPRPRVRVRQTPRLDLDPDKAAAIEGRLVAALRGIDPGPTPIVPRDRQSWPRTQQQTPIPPAEPEEWGREAWPLAP